MNEKEKAEYAIIVLQELDDRINKKVDDLSGSINEKTTPEQNLRIISKATGVLLVREEIRRMMKDFMLQIK